jgi:zinc/manganese transport system permease protein
VTRLTPLREDASFSAFYLISLALGVLLVSTHGSNVDLLHLLFGSILAIDNAALVLIGAVASMSLLSLAVIYRPLVVECFDPGFLRAVGGRGGLVHTVFLALVVPNLVAGFQALGTLMAVGLMMPANGPNARSYNITDDRLCRWGPRYAGPCFSPLCLHPSLPCERGRVR